MKRARAGAAALAAVIIAAGAFLYLSIYPVKTDCSNLEECASQFMRGEGAPPGAEVRVYDPVRMGREGFALIEYVTDGDGRMGLLWLSRGLGGRYRIEAVRYGTGNFAEEVVEANYQKYYLFGGRNACFGIAKAKVLLEGRTYILEIPERDCFLVCEEIDYTIRDTHCDLDQLRFYNSGGEDITDQVPWS